MGVTVGVGITFVLVEVGVLSGEVAVLVTVGEGWLPQATRESITRSIAMQPASQPGCLKVCSEIEVRSPWLY